jgi:transcription-repair coupling factor (superfamily II helicase)
MVDELIDRFGEPPRSVMNLVQIALLRGVAKKAYISEMRQTKSELRIVLYKKAKLDVSKLPEMVERHKTYVTFTLAGKNGPEYDVLYKKDSRISKQEPLEILQKFAEELSQIAGMASPEKG